MNPYSLMSTPRRISVGISVGIIAAALCACSSTNWPMAPAEIKVTNANHVSVKMAQLANCVSSHPSADQIPILDPQQALNIIVHGCNSSGGQYRALAEVFQKQGQQTLCFNYDDRDSISRSSEQLMEVLSRLVNQVGMKDITVLGHSQGGLIARRAMVRGSVLDTSLQSQPVQLKLVTVSSPFGGIQAASHCSSKPLAILSLGLTIPICQMVTGSKWNEIAPASSFVNAPGELMSAVRSHLKIVTDEMETCRTFAADGSCKKKDFIFSIEEQRQSVVDQTSVVKEQIVKAGHVEIVGDEHIIPSKLIAVLQQNDYLADRLPRELFLAELARIYKQDSQMNERVTPP